MRALEVVELTGRPFAATLPEPAARYDTVQIGLDRADLDERVAARVDRMWAAGLVAEVRALERRGLRDGPTASRALGYQQVLALGDTPEARAGTVTATRRFVRRQRSWFRRDPRVRWLDAARARPAGASAYPRPVSEDARWTRFVKGHGTENDFVVLPDAPPLDPQTVRALCDRRAGIGADGVLRVQRGAGVDGGFVMDYWNADGSVAEMCGNGIRVFARYLRRRRAGRAGHAAGRHPGRRPHRAGAAGRGRDGRDGRARCALEAAPTVGGRPGTAVSMGNPHVVVELPDLAALDALDLSRPPDVRPPLPDGQNVEWAVRRGPRSLAVRVHERGVGETRSCGTGVCAAVVAAVAWSGGAGLDDAWTVDVPGGRLTVTWLSAGPVLLSGPAVLVARGEVDLAALSRR